MKLSHILAAVIGGGAIFLGSTALATNAAANECVPIATDLAIATPMIIYNEPAIASSTGGEWVQESAGMRYYNGDTFCTGLQTIDHVYYTFDANGILLSGWHDEDGKHYYIDPDTMKPAVGLTEIDGSYYLFGYDGEQKTGWRNIDGNRYYFDSESGKMLTGWLNIDGLRYYCDETQGKLGGEFTVDGITYVSNEMYGYQLYGTRVLSDGSIHCYYYRDGSVYQGWKSEQNGQRYFDSTGTALTGLQTIEDKIYYFNAKAYATIGWKTIDGNRYYFSSPSGAAVTGIQTIDNHIYGFRSDGTTYNGWQTIDNNKYYFSAGGCAYRGLVTIDNQLYYFNTKGILQCNKTFVANGYEYTSDANGIATRGLCPVAGTSVATAEQMIAYIQSVNPNVSQYVIDMIPYYISEGEAEGIRGDIAFAQSCLETGNFKYINSAVSLSQNNFCGLGVTYNGVRGCSFATAQLGIRAQIQHLKAYSTNSDLNQAVVDPRFYYVSRNCAPYVEWLGIQENPWHKGWASGSNYGSKILNILNAILSM